MWEKYYIFFRIFDAADPKKLILQKMLQLVWCTLDYGPSLYETGKKILHFFNAILHIYN